MIRLLIHAPTPGSLERARRNAANLKKADPQAEVEIVVNAGAVAAALADALTDSQANAETNAHPTDAYLVLCQNTLTATGQEAPAHLKTVPAAVLHIATRQADGWAYMRA